MEEKGKKRKVQPWWNLAERIGQSIVNQAVDKGLTDFDAIAKNLKLDDVTVAQILAGRRNLRLSDIAKIEKDLGIIIVKIEEVDSKREEIKNKIIPKFNDLNEAKSLSSEDNKKLDNYLTCNEILEQAQLILKK